MGLSSARRFSQVSFRSDCVPFWKDPAQVLSGRDFVPFRNNHGKEVMWPADFAMMGAEERRTRHAKSLSLEPESRVPCGHMMVLGSLTSQTMLFSLRLYHFKNTKMHS